MVRLSSPLGTLASRYAVVVVGSGYGGGVAASRLARAGLEVCVLERGREHALGEFPTDEREAAEQSQASLPATPRGRLGSPLGLFDFHVDEDLAVLRGCGLGGTSLINAGVALPAADRVFEQPAWPRALVDDLAALRRYEDIARTMLEPRTYPSGWPRLAKLDAHRRSAAHMGERFELAPINVCFETGRNAFGSERQQCTLCGDCVTGCNVGAKHTVTQTYLRDAWNHGAAIFTEIRVDRVERAGEGGWALHVRPSAVGRERFDARGDMVVHAELVVLAAGTLGSTEILLRSRAAGLSLSPRLGEHFSGNADVLAFGYNNDRRIDGIGAGKRELDPTHPVGPTITSLIDGRTRERPLAQHFVLEEGALPGAIDAIYPQGFRMAARAHGLDTDSGLLDGIAETERELSSAMPGGVRRGALAHTQTYLGMGHDSGAGRLELDARGQLRVRWPEAAGERAIVAIHERLRAATAANGGTFVTNPLWSNLLRSSLITVHPLGGCGMGEDASVGVTNHKGQVFAGSEGEAVHEGLYVADGSVLPTPIGVNPLLTITALAERSIAAIVHERGLTIDYDVHARPATPRTPAPSRIGVRFTERMAGALADGERGLAGDHAAAAALGQACAFVLTLMADDLEAVLVDPHKRMAMVGTLECGLLADAPLQVEDGEFRLLAADPERIGRTQMVYAMTLVAADGRRFRFRGVKYVENDRGPDLWADTTTLFVDVHDEAGRALARGLLRIGLADFAEQLRTIRVSGTSSPLAALDAQLRFGRFFVGSLYDSYADVFARPSVFDPEAPPRKRRPLRCGPPQIHYFFTSDRVQLCLTRYEGGSKGPVVLVHGLGVSSAIFTVDTIPTNLVEHLVAAGYDVWLLDYRSSFELAAAAQPSDGDVIAAIDIPEAVAQVRARTGAASVQMVVHCFGATVTFMSLLSGKLVGVRSLVASQATPIVAAAPIVRLKSGLHLPSALAALGVDTLTAYTDKDAGWLDTLYDRALALYPLEHEEHCRSATCHRISFMYSLLYEHDQLAVATHDTLHELFGVACVPAFAHLAAMVRAGRVVDAAGRDVYLPHVERLALPIRIIHGAENACFGPAGSEATLAWLREHHDPSLHSRVVIPGFGHIDCIFGERAAAAVYPHILEHLERT